MDFLSGGDLRYHIGLNRRFNEEKTSELDDIINPPLRKTKPKN